MTHYLEEAEQCNRLGFMVAGEIVAQGSPSEMKANMKGSLYEMEVDHPDRALGVLKKKFGASRVTLFGDRLHLVIENDEQKRQAGDLLKESGIRIVPEKPVQFSLEDVFISLPNVGAHTVPGTSVGVVICQLRWYQPPPPIT